MPRQYNIRWREQDEKELRRVVRNFNDKLRRLVKKNPDNANILPQYWNESTQQFENRLSVQQVKELIGTRQDYNRQLNMLKRFSRRGAERIVELPSDYRAKTTAWQKREQSRLVQIINRRRNIRLETLNAVEMMNATGKLGYTLGQRFGMGLAEKNKLKPTKAFTKGQSQKDIKWKWRALQMEAKDTYYNERDEMLKNNFIRTLEENFDSNDIQDVVANIRAMSSDEFYLKYQAKGDAFEWAYPPAKGSKEYYNYVNELKGYWKGANSLLDLSPTMAGVLANI
jgi:hypothetical protein